MAVYTFYILADLLVLAATINIDIVTQNEVLNTFVALDLCKDNSLYILICIYFLNITK